MAMRGHKPGNVMDYADYLQTSFEGEEPRSMIKIGDGGIMWIYSASFNFDTETFVFNGLTEEDSPEDFLYKCVELFGMPNYYDHTSTSDSATWVFDAPNPGAIDVDSNGVTWQGGSTVEFQLNITPNNEDYQVYMKIGQLCVQYNE